MKKIKFILLACILLIAINKSALAKDDLSISLSVFMNGYYAKPYDNRIVVKQRPVPFYVELKNNARSSQLIYRKAQANVLAGLEFEIIDKNQRKTIVTRKKENLSSDVVVSKHLGPGKIAKSLVIINPDEWENSSVMKPQQEYQVRVIYNNNRTKIYSDYYTVVIRTPN